MRQRALAIGLCLVSASVLFAQTKSPSMDLWVGTWNQNGARSTPPVQPPAANTTKLDIVNGMLRITTDVVNAQGQKVHRVNMVVFDGKEHPFEGGAPGSTRLYTWIDDHTYERVNKVNGKVVNTTRVVLSPDRKTHTLFTTGTDAQGRKFSNALLFEKQ